MQILLDDGLIVLEIMAVTDTAVNCRVLTGGELADNKGKYSGRTPADAALSEKDRADIIFAMKYDFDFIAASLRAGLMIFWRYVRFEEFHSDIPIIAKIEMKAWPR